MVNHSKRWAASALGVAAAAIALAGCAGPSGDSTNAATGSSDPAIIAAPIQMTGANASVGADIQAGAQYAIDQINAAGGIGGRQLKLEVQDTAGDQAQAVQLVTSFSKDPNVMMILGPVNAAEVGAVAGIGQSAGVVIFPPASSGAVPGITNGKFNDWTFRINEAQPLVMGPTLTSVMDITKAKDVTILNYSDNAAYVSTGDLWEQSAKAAGANVHRFQFPAATQDYSSLVTSIPADTDLIALGALAATDADLVRSIRQAGIQAAILGDASILASQVFTGSQGLSKGAYSYSTYLPDATAASKKFNDDYTAKTGAAPSAIAAYAYDAIELMANAVGNGPFTRQAVRDGLAATKDFQGVSGVISYNGSGDALRASVPLVQVGDNGELTKVGEITPATTQ